jgi:hypothetical protein
MGSGAGFGAPLLDRPIADITTLDVVAVLETVWHDKPEVARKLQVRSEWPERKAAGPFYRPAMSAEWKTARCEIGRDGITDRSGFGKPTKSSRLCLAKFFRIVVGNAGFRLHHEGELHPSHHAAVPAALR